MVRKVISLNIFFFELLVTISEESLVSHQYVGYSDDRIGIPLKFVESVYTCGADLF